LLVAIEDPNGTDPTAKGINATLYEGLGGAGVQLAKSDKKYALDEIACDGSVRWSTTTQSDLGRSGVMFKPGNVGADVDAAFRTAIADAIKAHTDANIVEPAPPPAVSDAAGDSAPAAIDPKDTLLLIPIEEPGIADPHAADMTHSLVLTMQKRGMTVKTTSALDHNKVVHDAATLCSANGANSIIVPHIRVEQSGYSGRSHASFATTLVSCAGVPIAHGANDADMPGGGWANFTASATGVFERAVTPALDSLYSVPKPAAAGPPQPVSSSGEAANNKP
jgi:hypothetical protein